MSSPDPFQDLVNALRRTLTSTSTPASPASTSAFRTTVSSPSVLASPMARPAPFSGLAEDCNGFILQCSLVLEMQPHLYLTIKRKLLLSFNNSAIKHSTGQNPFGHRTVLSCNPSRPSLVISKRFLENRQGIHLLALISRYRQGLDPRVRLHLAAYEDSIGLEKFIQLSIRFATHMQLCIEEHQSQRLFPSFLRQPEFVSFPESASYEMQIDRSRLSPAERQRRLTQGLCLYCGLPGHIRVECPTRPTRSMVSVILPTLNHQNPITIVVYLTAADVCIPVNAFIDSGSAGNLISGALCRQLNLKTVSSPKIYQIHAVTGRLQIGILHQEDIHLLVLEESTSDVILGRPWLDQHDPNISWRTGDILKWASATVPQQTIHTGVMNTILNWIRPQRSPEVSAEIESTRSSIVKASSTRQPVAQFLNKPTKDRRHDTTTTQP
ncbi:Retrotransposon-derived protein PEG10 [Anabarilius grahami]|uniref:Retrotransposon-derived protein PEG10 n=1 Tax=Anabarilius grahami TaxID=495550 RepID=A0A3N0XZU7_ANAGA|nr:Retrotransposon-derived protein PEG10 [Anabarilius grahami]